MRGVGVRDIRVSRFGRIDKAHSNVAITRGPHHPAELVLVPEKNIIEHKKSNPTSAATQSPRS